MAKLLLARAARDEREEHDVRRLAGARHAPGDWIARAQIVVLSWDGLRPPVIAGKVGCHPETVRRRLHRFNTEGIDGLGDRPGPGRRPRLTETERSQIIALVKTVPPGRPALDPWLDGLAAADDEAAPGVWTLDTLTGAAHAAGIDVHRSQVRRILLAEGVRWRRPRSWTTSKDPQFAARQAVGEVVSAEVVVGDVGGERGPHGGQDAVTDCDEGAFLAASGRDPPETAQPGRCPSGGAPRPRSAGARL